jgi:hypothetical protein
MQETERPNGTLQFIYTHWPRFAIVYGGIIAALLVIGVSADRGWVGLVPLATAVLLILTVHFATSLWVGYQLYDQRGLRPHVVLFEMGQIVPTGHLVYIDTGLRQRPVTLSRRLTTGQITVVDIYHPQLLPSRALARWRGRAAHLSPDPRLSWRDGQINLLPLPDESVSNVILCQVLSEIVQQGDRLALLHELFRILKPDGHILFAEPCRTQTAWLAWGPTAVQIPTITHWRRLLTDAGFRLQREQSLNGLIHCIRAYKPVTSEAHQLAFDLKF